MVAVASLLTVVVAGLVVARIATVALVATGLPVEVARFQARSALTGAGFTTSESEGLVGHPVRRRIVLWLMVIGNAGFVTLVASVMLPFVTSGGTGDTLARLGLMIGGLAIISLVTRTRIFQTGLTNLAARLLNRFSDLETRDFHHLLRLSRDFAITELAVEPGDWLSDKALSDLDLPDEGVLLLAIQRRDGRFVGAPRGSTEIAAGDTVYLYGRASALSELDNRPATPSGEQAHRAAVAEHHGTLDEGEGEGGEADAQPLHP